MGTSPRNGGKRDAFISVASVYLRCRWYTFGDKKESTVPLASLPPVSLAIEAAECEEHSLVLMKAVFAFAAVFAAIASGEFNNFFLAHFHGTSVVGFLLLCFAGSEISEA